MSSIERFEDLDVWKKSRVLTNEVYDVTLSGSFARDFKLHDQLRAAAVSIMSNIAEGFERDGDNEFAQFLALAKGSAGEVRSELYVSLDRKYLTPAQFEVLFAHVSEISRMLFSLSRYLRQSNLRGRKYKKGE
ncbi:MAG: four helix bundle protein [Planctomycetes bacterium]|nr:four helix bundle protein [Planctomycetota bacterium]